MPIFTDQWLMLLDLIHNMLLNHVFLPNVKITLHGRHRNKSKAISFLILSNFIVVTEYLSVLLFIFFILFSFWFSRTRASITFLRLLSSFSSFDFCLLARGVILFHFRLIFEIYSCSSNRGFGASPGTGHKFSLMQTGAKLLMEVTIRSNR